jgi:hypothetical protein
MPQASPLQILSEVELSGLCTSTLVPSTPWRRHSLDWSVVLRERCLWQNGALARLGAWASGDHLTPVPRTLQ